MLLALLGALVIGASLGVMGSGGSILTVPVLIYVLGHADKPAIAESLAIVGGIAFIGAIPGVLGRIVHWRTVLLFGVPAMAGTYLGAWASLWVSGTVQLLLFAIVMVLAAGLMLRKQRGTTDSRSTNVGGHSYALVICEGLGVGALTGLVGVGGGFLIVPALVLLGGLGMHRAVATSLVIIVFKSMVGLWKYLVVLSELDLHIDWNTIGLFILVGGGGAVLAGRFHRRIDQEKLKQIFGVFLIIMAIVIGWQELSTLASDDEMSVDTVSSETNESEPASSLRASAEPVGWPLCSR
jgi:uncharacterized membrane protein YfcA